MEGSQVLGSGETYPVRDTPTHTSNECHTTSISPPDHLFRNRLRRHENTSDVDLEHHVCVLGRVLEGRGFLLYPRCGQQAVHAPFLFGDVFDDRVELGHVSDVDLAVVEGRAQFFRGAFLDAVEIVRGGGEAVERVDWKGCVRSNIVYTGAGKLVWGWVVWRVEEKRR